MNKIVIELCAEDRQRLDLLLETGRLIQAELQHRRESAEAARLPRMGQAPDGTVMIIPDHPADAPATHLEPPDPAPVSAPKAKPVSLGEFQKAIVTRCAESLETKKKVQALVHKYADSVSAIPEDKRAEVLSALAEI